MTEITIKMLAEEIHTSVVYLIQQFADAGICKSADDLVSVKEKQILFEHLKKKCISTPEKFVIQRKMHSTLNISKSGGKSKLVKIEIRKKSTFFKRSSQEEKEYLAVAAYIKREEKEKENYVTKTVIGHEIKLNVERNTVEKKEQKNLDKIIEKKIENMDKTSQKVGIYYENEKIPNIKNNEKEFFHIVKEHNDTGSDIKNAIKDSNDFHMTVSQAYPIRNENNHEIKENRNRHRNRSSKSSYLKKENRYFEEKTNREESYYITRSNKNNKRKNSSLQQSFQKPIQAINRNIIIGEAITIGELANKMAVKSSQVIKVMMKLGAMVTINQTIDQETAQIVAEEMGHKVILRREDELETAVMDDRDIEINAIAESRAPVVTIMGHVDHGKTSLLDCIRSTKIASREAGGITQHIGAYHVKTKNGMITFLDTPGHAAFTSMRARGTQITDIVVLVVSADDGVMPQTIEAIQHAKAAQVPIVVAINKIDKPEADPNRVKIELAKHDILSEEWGGNYQFIHVSSKTGTGIKELLDAILLQAEIMELKAIHKGMATGAVIESFLDKGRGPVATVLIREGTLNKGDVVLCGFEYGRIRAMRNEFGKEILKAGPSIPVEIFGLSGVPSAGDKVTIVRDEKKAREVALYRQGKFREVKLAHQQKSKFENVFSNMGKGEAHEMNIILKADVQGSVEAISNALLKLSTNEVKIKLINSSVGGITETDAVLAIASNAILVGFNVRADTSARRIIELENLNLRYYSVIYNLIDDIKAAMNGMLSPELQQKIIGLAEVRNVFHSLKFGTIAGCMVIEGTVKRHNSIRILRENVVIYEGELESLRRFKDDVSEVRNGMECGLRIKNYNDIQVGDMIEMFKTIEVQRSIN